jgi:hypothetical protein
MTESLMVLAFAATGSGVALGTSFAPAWSLAVGLFAAAGVIVAAALFLGYGVALSGWRAGR